MKKCVIKPLSIAALASLFVLSGCFFEGEQSLEEMDVPEEVTNVDPENEQPDDSADDSGEAPEEAEGEQEETSNETVKRQLYLLDANGMVVPQTLDLPKISSKEVATQSLEYLVKGGPVTELLPEGFQAVLPQGTEIKGLNLKEDGTLVVDVSKEFADYRAEEEADILQAMTFTLTQFDNVDKIKLWINGYEKTEMPVSGTPISDGVSRSNGINLQGGQSVDLVDSRAVTLYYPAQNEANHVYHVPVTTRVKGDGELNEAIVQALVDGPAFNLPLLSAFNDGVQLQNTALDDGVLSLTFNEALLTNAEESSVSDAVMKSLVMSLTEQEGVEAVNVQIEGFEQIYNENGEDYAEPVTRNDVTGAEPL
ncbi:GerMN domain-containing protein [Thalassobacillus sp. CUG 92003]|uniref:GerMN domain-containing protein n=1 Tax=Thalassobacillus sp. CUG 92003 TaxID=2736641 RepID=UPI0015E671D0|nr:GerMN domain-containing protein [Thalassobacillus sp. CUG 92003]